MDPEIDTVVAHAHGSLVGFSTLRPCGEPDLDAATHGEMPTLYVHPGYWRLGYGRHLCLETLSRASDRRFSSVVLWVIDINERARLFYENFGFRFDGTTRSIEESRTPLTARRYRIELGTVA